MSGWQALAGELARWREAGRTAELWWRDDDAALATPALARLLEVSQRSKVAVALAAIPAAAQAEALAEAQCVIQHGCDHRNRAAAGGKKSEFAAGESEAAALERLAAARERLARLAGARFVAVLAPPWNRFPDALAARLPQAGIHGLTRYGARRTQATGGVREANTHADIIAWRRDRRFVGDDAALAMLVEHLRGRRLGELDADEPTGLLTHHALHDALAWHFLERLLDASRAAGARWLDAREVFPSPL